MGYLESGENMEPLQEKCLEMTRNTLCHFVSNVNYYVIYAVVGPLEHFAIKGFIPWDDDLDFFMPRKDYEKLIELWPKEADERYVMSNSDEHYPDRNLFCDDS